MAIFLIYFYIYCFIGWVYESLYDSLRDHRFVNRGFMHGPFLPIYGVGALLCITSADLANHVLWLTFLYAVIVCTVMELLTGMLMERIFKVRYWDYSKLKFNVKGYIAPPVSLLWGILAVVVSEVVNPFIVDLVAMIPSLYLEGIGYVLTIGIASDFTLSWIEAIHLRKMLEELSENSRQLKEIRKKLEEIQEAFPRNTQEAKAKIMNLGDEARAKLDQMQMEREARFNQAKEQLKEIPEELKNTIIVNADSLEQRIKAYYDKRSEQLEQVRAKVGELKETSKGVSKEDIQKRHLIDQAIKRLQGRLTRSSDDWSTHASRILRRNPYAMSSKYQKEIDILKQMNRKYKNRNNTEKDSKKA